MSAECATLGYERHCPLAEVLISAMGGDRARANERALARQHDAANAAGRGCWRQRCAVPVGRAAHFFDLDLVADLGAHQRRSQVCFYEVALARTPTY